MTLGGAGAMLAQLIYWIGNWPIKPIDTNTATAAAGLIIIGVGYLVHRASLPQPPPAQEPKP